MTDRETIAAISTGFGGGIGIVRLSGPRAREIAAEIFRGSAKKGFGAARLFLYPRECFGRGEKIGRGAAVAVPGAEKLYR